MIKKKDKKEDSRQTGAGKTEGTAVLEDTLKAIQNKFGEGSIMKFGDSPKVDINVIPTGSIGLDMALGVGGIPRGRIIEIFGPESSGKTTLSLHIVGEAQKMGGVCAYIDAEHAMDPEYTKKLGVNINNLLISQPDNGEQALEIVESLVRTGKIDVIVVDSVAALRRKSAWLQPA
jgi:recombination protein RecA